MTEWEYTRIEIEETLTGGGFVIRRDGRLFPVNDGRPLNQEGITKFLNNLGSQGWELVDNSRPAIFKRPVCKIPETFKIPLDGKFIMVCTGMTHQDAVHAMNVIRIVRESSQQFGIISLPVGASFKLVEIEDTEDDS